MINDPPHKTHGVFKEITPTDIEICRGLFILFDKLEFVSITTA